MLASAPHTLQEDVQNQLVEAIHQGYWKQGEVLPSEKVLALQYGVSLGTVRKALAELERLGVLVRRQGKGTFVASASQHLAALRRRINWFVPDDPAMGSPVSRLVLFESIPAPLRVIRLLGCQETDSVYHIRREAHYAGDDKVCIFDDTYLMQKDFPGLTEESVQQSLGAGMYLMYARHYGYYVERMQDTARAVLLNPIQAQKAGVSVPYPAISFRRMSLTGEGKIVELRYIVHVTLNQYMQLRYDP